MPTAARVTGLPPVSRAHCCHMLDPARAMTLWTARNRQLADLLARVVLRDQRAFAELYRLSSAHLFGVILRIHRDRNLAEEVLQETYIKIWHKVESFDSAQGVPLTWLTSVARNLAIDRWRREQSQPLHRPTVVEFNDRDEPVESLLEDPGEGPLALLGRAVEARALQHCVEGLSPPQRQSVALAFYDGLSHSEVAEQLGQPLGTVKSWIRRAMQALKACLERAVDRDATAG